MKFYRIDLEYVKYLYKFDKRVQYNEKETDIYNKRRPYVGVVLNINDFQYFVPLEHPRDSHIKLKSNIHIEKIKNGKYGLLAFNNMIPVPQEQLILFDFKNEIPKYQEILKNQFIYCSKNDKKIRLKASRTYERRCNSKDIFVDKVYCDFKLLEEKCKEYVKEKSMEDDLEL